MRLKDKVAIVTGAGRGIGEGIALRFSEEGARVIVNDVSEMDAHRTVETIKGTGGKALPVVGSVASREVVQKMVDTAVKEFGTVDILVNNAGIIRDAMLHKMTDEQWDLVIDVNLTGSFNCIRSAAPYLRDAAKKEMSENGEVARVRKIVNFFSTAAIRGNPGQANYTAAKMGNVGLTRTFAQEWGRYRICVNAVAPGFVETRMTAPKQKGDLLGIPEEMRQALLQRIPFRRFGQPQDIANAVLFLSSPLSDYVTGQEFNVSGGLQIP